MCSLNTQQGGYVRITSLIIINYLLLFIAYLNAPHSAKLLSKPLYTFGTETSNSKNSQILKLRSRNQIRLKLLLSRKLRHFRGSCFSCFIPSTSPHLVIKKGFLLIIILSNYQYCPLSFYLPCSYHDAPFFLSIDHSCACSVIKNCVWV